MALLDTQMPRLIAATSRDDWDRARLYGRTATGLLRYHYWMADTSPARMTRLSALRDAMMAANLLAIAERGPALVLAHNLHLQRDKSTMRMGDLPLEWWSAGAIVSAPGRPVRLPGHGPRHDPATTPRPRTPSRASCTRSRGTTPSSTPAAWPRPSTEPAPRVSPGFGYFPLDPAQLATIDGIVFVKQAVRLEKLG